MLPSAEARKGIVLFLRQGRDAPFGVQALILGTTYLPLTLDPSSLPRML